MSLISDCQIIQYVEANIGTFHDKRLEALNKLKLQTLLRRKNPYLFKSRNLVIATDLIRSLLDAYLSSQEETLFGDFLEGLAIYVAQTVYAGWKSSAPGIDLEFAKDNSRYIVSIKSGPYWGNSSQKKKMESDFSTAAQVIRQGNINTSVIPVNGCCYGREAKSDKGTYHKLCGQEFWELISGDAEFYTRIVEPLGHKAKERNKSFMDNYGAVVNLFSKQFSANFCDSSGAINWDKLVAFSSAKGKAPKLEEG